MDRPKKTAIEQVYKTAHGAFWTVQLREKTASNAELRSLALQLHLELNAVSVKQIIKDRIDIMLRADAEMQIQLSRNHLNLQIIE